MDIQRLWESSPRGHFKGALRNWDVPSETKSCGIVINHGDDSQRGFLIQRTYFWHYLLDQGDDVIHYRHTLGAMSFKRGLHEEIDIITPPLDYTPLDDHDNTIRERLSQIAGHFAKEVPTVEAYTLENGIFRPILFEAVTPLYTPKELIYFSKPRKVTERFLDDFKPNR